MQETHVGDKRFCIILCGGVGNRLWPFSRRNKPKQFLDLLGMGKTMLQITYARIARLIPEDHIFLVTSREYVSLVNEQLPTVDVHHIIGETATLGTAPSVALACSYIYRLCRQASVLVTPADQLIVNEEDFRRQISSCLDFADTTSGLVAIGVKPTWPDTTYGYIQTGQQCEGNFFRVKSFTEKPSMDFARLFCESGEFFWSTGLFVCHVQTYLENYAGTHPNVKELLQKINHGISDKEFQEFVDEHYSRTVFLQLDMFVLEHCPNVYINVCTFGWADIGDWNSLYRASQKNADENVLLDANAALYDCHQNIIHVPEDKVVFIKGLDNYLICENDNVLVICPKDDPSCLRHMFTDAQMKYGHDME